VKKIHVLLVDDQVLCVESLRRVIEGVAPDLVVDAIAENGKAAIAAAEKYRPDVVLMDVRMPTMDGWEFARRYRARPGTKAPIVVMTAAQDASQRAAQIGADFFLAKPFDLDALYGCVSRFAAST